MGQNFIRSQVHIRKPDIRKLLNRFNNFCYLRTSLDLKMQDIVQISNQRDNQNYGTKFYKKSVSRFGNYWIDSIIFAFWITR